MAKVDSTMMPRPPTWIMARMSTCPSDEKSCGVSSTMRPVTQVALVAVNRASIGDTGVSPAEAAGKVRSTVPTRISVAKEMTIRRDGRS